ncbi:hypothetical protein VPH35_132179 [Triticum aestivum]
MAQPNYNLSISPGKKTKRTAAITIDEDVLLEILFRVSADIAALFRCAAACKRWCALIADPSFLHRRWPEKTGHPSALVGFFIQRNRGNSPEPPAFVPAPSPSPSGPTLGGSWCRSLSWLVRGVPAGLLDGAKPLAARGGLVLVHLVGGGRSCTNSIHLAVCDVLARTCHVLPPLQCLVSAISCALLTGSDYCSSGRHRQRQRQRTSTPGYSTFFTVLTLVNSIHGQDRRCDLYSFSSAKPGWSAPKTCFGDKIWSDARKGGLWMQFGRHSQHKAVVYGGMTHWVAAYLSENTVPQKYYTFNVNIETGHISLTELSIPADQLTQNPSDWPMLSVGVDKTLTLFYVYEEAGIRRLDIWKHQQDNACRESAASSFWLRVGAFDLKSPKDKWDPRQIRVWSGEKSNTLFILDTSFPAHKLDTQTGVMEIVTGLFQRELCIGAVFMEIDWPTLFLSRL